MDYSANSNIDLFPGQDKPRFSRRFIELRDKKLLIELDPVAPGGSYALEYYTLTEDCHRNCLGCFEPGRIDRCLACRKGWVFVDGACVGEMECLPPNFMNAIGEC
jgi:hypothetical protein